MSRGRTRVAGSAWVKRPVSKATRSDRHASGEGAAYGPIIGKRARSGRSGRMQSDDRADPAHVLCGTLFHDQTVAPRSRTGDAMDTSSKELLTFEPPGPGPWELDPVHFPRPVTPYWAEMHPEPFAHGFGDMTAYYGAPFQTRRTAYVSGF